MLTFLIGLQGSMATVSAISRVVGYTETAVRDALKDMVLARLVRETSDRPARYRALHRPWVNLLELDAVERSRHALEFHGIDLPELDRYPGHSFVEALLEITESVSAWTEEHL